MRILVACEESQVCCKAFREQGHEAYSCDLQPCSGGRPEWHFQRDVFEVLSTFGPFDLMVAFPPCTHLAASGAQYWPEKRKDGRQQAALELVRSLYWADVPRVAIENPTGVLTRLWMPPMQTLQPFHHGDPYTKRTCLWLRNLPLLRPSRVVKPTHRFNSNATRGGKRRDGTRKRSSLPTRLNCGSGSVARSKLCPGIAAAMARQWGQVTLGTQPCMSDFFHRDD